jgi:hypothetical protein
MNSIKKDFKNLGKESSLVILPVSRLEISEKVKLGKFVLYPRATTDIDELLSNVYEPELETKKELFRNATLIAFEKRHSFSNLFYFHLDRSLILECSEEAEKIIDIIRFYYCSYNNPYSLSNKASQIDDGRSGLLLYSSSTNLGRITIQPIFSYKHTLGNGLFIVDVNWLANCNLFKSPLNQVGHIVEHALSLNTSILEANNQTTKFTNIMTLIEYLAYPDCYKTFKDVKKEIAVHIAQNNSDYQKLLERFYELTSKDGYAYRTKIIHQGERIENILNDPVKLEILFDELQYYTSYLIKDLIERCDKSGKKSRLGEKIDATIY